MLILPVNLPPAVTGGREAPLYRTAAVASAVCCEPEATDGGYVVYFSITPDASSSGSEGVAYTTVTGERNLAELATPLAMPYAKLDELRSLPADWDSYGAAPISGKAVRAARRLLGAVGQRFARDHGTRINPYHIAPLAYGGIHLEWQGPEASLEVYVDPSETYGYLLIEGSGDGRTFTERDDAKSPEILRLVARVLGA